MLKFHKNAFVAPVFWHLPCIMEVRGLLSMAEHGIFEETLS